MDDARTRWQREYSESRAREFVRWVQQEPVRRWLYAVWVVGMASTLRDWSYPAECVYRATFERARSLTKPWPPRVARHVAGGL